jgi:TonB family protein
MQISDVPPARTRTAIALSIALHVCALWLLALLVESRELPAAGDGVASVRVFALTTVTRRPAAPATRRIAAAPRRTPAPRRLEPAAVTPASVDEPVRSTAVEAAAPSASDVRSEAQHAPRAPASNPLSVALVAAQPKATAMAAAPSPPPAPPTPAPTPAPTPDPSPPPTPPAANFGGLFSQNYPPAVAEPGEVARLRARLGSPVHVRIDIDENGRATEVRFVHPLADPDLAAEVRTTLLAWRYVPADCNGLHCDGTLEITF